MSTPAEIIAARVNGTLGTDESTQWSTSSGVDSDDNTWFDKTDNQSMNSSAPSISDESAFPALGGKKASLLNSTPSWGPNVKVSTNGSHRSVSPVQSTPKVGTGKVKASTVQDAFSLNAEDQMNITRPEFIKILTAIKSETKTNIECTTSQHTKKRTFLITGKSEEIKLAKRLVIKKLTKPVKITFSIPSRLRSRVIGQQGRVLKPIIQENEVKIDIGQEEESGSADNEDDIFAVVVNITVEGDIEGSKRAKKQILAIVDEETKNLTLKVPVDDEYKPFIASHLKSVTEKYSNLDIFVPTFNTPSSNIIIAGEREFALNAKNEIKSELSKLPSLIETESIAVPKVKHSLLPIEPILEKFNVLIKLPNEPETKVKFIGPRESIIDAQEEARKITSQYKVETLDMSKAHKGNLKHVKAVASFLNSNGTFKKIAEENSLSINAPIISALDSQELKSIPIEIVAKNDDPEKIKNAKKKIVSVVNSISVDSTRVIEDIDSFLLDKVPENINDLARELNISYVIIAGVITLISNKQEEEQEDFDFESGNTSNDSEAFEIINRALDSLRELASQLSTIVLEIPSDKQAFISGSKGTTLKLLLNQVEPKSVTIQLHSNSSEASENELLIKGISKDVKIVKNSIENVLADAESFKDSFETSISVPSLVVSRLIGKNGTHLNQLKDEFGVKIDFDDFDELQKNEKTNIAIKGAKLNSENCKDRILQLTKKLSDEKMSTLRIENAYHGRIIGRNGIYINRLQEKYNVKIRFPNENSKSSSTDAPRSKDEVTIKGPSKGVTKAEEELRELYEYEKENGNKETLSVPLKAIARVIGKAGETIKDIADHNGIEFKFNRDDEKEEKSGFAEVELTGTKKGLREAKKSIEEIISEVENTVKVTINVNPKFHRDLVGTGGAVMKEIISKAGGNNVPRQRHFKLLSIPDEGSNSDEVTSEGDKSIVDKIVEQVKKLVALKEASVVEQYDLSKEKHRLIVGAGGSIRHSLQDEFNVAIDIPRPNNESSVIKLSGLPENIEKLKVKLYELTKDDWNVTINIPEAYHALVSERGAIFKRLKYSFNVDVQHGNLTRRAANLSNSAIPIPPESAYPDDDEQIKFTVTVGEENTDTSKTIPWRLKGDDADTKKVAKLIESRLKLAEEAISVGWFYAKDTSNFNRVVGPQGSVINRIREETKTFITTPRPVDKNPNFIYLVGKSDNLTAAKDAIQKVLNK